MGSYLIIHILGSMVSDLREGFLPTACRFVLGYGYCGCWGKGDGGCCVILDWLCGLLGGLFAELSSCTF